MTDDELEAIHAAALSVPRPWKAAEIGTMRVLPGSVLKTAAQGFALGRVILDEAELLTIAVHPDYQRSGQGRGLLNAFHATVRTRGAIVCHLEVAETNTAARSFYGKTGYVTVGRRVGYYDETDPATDAVAMRIDL